MYNKSSLDTHGGHEPQVSRSHGGFVNRGHSTPGSGGHVSPETGGHIMAGGGGHVTSRSAGNVTPVYMPLGSDDYEFPGSGEYEYGWLGSSSSPEETRGLEEGKDQHPHEQLVFSSLEIIFIVYLSVVFLLACLSNTSVLLAFFRKSSLRTTSNRFVIQLLFVNLLCCCMLLPLVLLEIVFHNIPGQCTLSESVSNWIASLSVLSTLLIGGDQYLAVKFPLRYRHHVTRTRACVSQLSVCTLSTLLSVLCSLFPPPNSFWRSCNSAVNTSGHPTSSTSTLPTPTTSISVEISYALTGVSVVVSFILPVLCLAVIYCKIFREAHNNSARTRRNSLNPSENLYNLTSTLFAPLTISQADLKKLSKHHSLSQSPKTSRSEPALERHSSGMHRSPSHIKTNLSQLRHRISNASQIMQREEGRTARLYTLTLTSILVCWSPYYLSSLARLVPWFPALPQWSMYLLLSPCFLYPLISPFIFATRNQKMKKELRRIFQIGGDDEAQGLPPPNRKLGRSISMRESVSGKGKEAPRGNIRNKMEKDGHSLLIVRSTRSSFSSTTTNSSNSTGATLTHGVMRYPRLEATC